MNFVKRIYCFFMILIILICFASCNKTEMDKLYLKVNSDTSPSELYHDILNKNEYNYIIENINNLCSVEISFELYSNGQLLESFNKINDYTMNKNNSELTIGLLEAYPVLKDTNGEQYISFAIKNNNYTKFITIDNFYNNITDYNIETKDNFYLNENTEYSLLSFYAGEKPNMKSIECYIDRNNYLIDNYKYVYFFKIKYIDK